MSHPSPGIELRRQEIARSGVARAARWGVMLALIASSLGCVLTQDIPDPAMDVPGGYKYGGPRAENAPPALDWWRGFNSTEMTSLMEEAQRVNLDIAAAVARMVQADALARQAGAALLPTLQGSGSQTYSRTSGSSASGLTNNGREITNYNASLSAAYQLDFWGGNRDALQAAEETATANRFDRDVTALTTLTAVATAYFNVLASQDRLRTAQQNIASAQRILNAVQDRRKGAGLTSIPTWRSRKVVLSPTRGGAGARRFQADASTRTVNALRRCLWCRGRPRVVHVSHGGFAPAQSQRRG